jgi:hypothetical protein
MYEMFSRTKLSTFLVLRNISEIIFVALTIFWALQGSWPRITRICTDEIQRKIRVNLCNPWQKKLKPQAFINLNLGLPLYKFLPGNHQQYLRQ